jgi:hypothetical protein
MKADHDKRIQEALDKKFSGLENVEESEVDAYKLVYESLSEPSSDFSLPMDFADHTVLKIERRNNFKSLVFLVSSIIGVCIAFTGSAMALIHYYPSFGTEIKSILTFKASFVFLLALLVAIQIMDWWLVKRKTFWYS